LRGWRRAGRTRLFDCRVFRLDRVEYEPPEGGPADDFYVLDAPDWVNVIPLSDDGRVYLVRQYRVGLAGETLEIPGGMCDEGEPPAAAAARELREETGCSARALVPLGFTHPNPALQSNRCHSFLALGATTVAEPTPDAHESFDVLAVPLAEIPGKIRSGEITHSLVIAAFHFLELRGAPPRGQRLG